MNKRLMMTIAAISAIAWRARAEVTTSAVEERACDEVRQAVDLRVTFPVTKLVDEPALTGITYSAYNWRLNAAADPTCKATITACAGTLADGVFTPEGTDVTVLAPTEGEGTITWTPAEISKKVYRLVHRAVVGSTPDEAATYYGYLDFSECRSWASQADVEQAVLGAVTHPITVTQDEILPWQPIDTAVSGSGLRTLEMQSQDDNPTTTVFSFSGRGTFHYAYTLEDGVLEVTGDGERVALFDAPTADWQACTIAFMGYGAHQVTFAYAAGILGQTASLRGVRWEEESDSSRAEREVGNVRTDLREGVRKPRRQVEILPFEYSSTNWIGDVVGVTPESVARVAVVRLEGTDPCVTNWTEVAETEKVLWNKPGEGHVTWKSQIGYVWKATFDIRTAGKTNHVETAYFDLRDTKGRGTVILVK